MGYKGVYSRLRLGGQGSWARKGLTFMRRWRMGSDVGGPLWRLLGVCSSSWYSCGRGCRHM